jgi:hypothetical protein
MGDKRIVKTGIAAKTDSGFACIKKEIWPEIIALILLAIL